MKELITKPLTFMINISLETGVFPNKLKYALVRPIYKKGNRNNIKNYRPVALLSNISKIWEKIIAKQLTSFLHKNQLLTKHQHGFTKNKNTTTAVIELLTSVITALSSKKKTVSAHLDLSKAFDSINHQILLLKLEAYGVRGIALELMKSYLSNRRQKVALHDRKGNICFSDWQSIEKGVPQGSILGPLLFVIYMNDLPSALGEDTTTIYADDTSRLVLADNEEELCEASARAIVNTKKWLENNQLTLNTEKTNLLYYSANRRTDILDVKVDNFDLTTCSSAKFLGIILDKHLTWKPHIDELASKISTFSYILRTLKNEISREAALTAYYAFVQSRISYGLLFWGNASDWERIFRLQKRCIRHIFHLPHRKSCRDTFKNHRIPTLSELYISQCVLYVHKQVNPSDKHIHGTRLNSNSFYRKPFTSHLETLNKQFLSQAIIIYNHLPDSIKNLSTIKLKQKLKRLQGNAVYTVDEFFRLNLEEILA